MFGRAKKKNQGSLLADRMKRVSGMTDPGGPGAKTPPARALARRTRAKREPSFREGLLKLSPETSEPVVVKNVSTSGARVDFSREFTIPDRVFLSAGSLGIRTWARVVWRANLSVGLEFEAS